MKSIVTLVCLSAILTGCFTTPDTPVGPKVKDGRRIYYPASNQNVSQPLNQGVPFDQTANTNVDFPEPSNTTVVPATDANIPDTTSGNIPPNAMPTKSTAENGTTPKTTAVSGTAVATLVEDAQKAMAEKRFDRAASSLDRAVRIEPNSAYLWYNLATVKLYQEDYNVSENYAKKSIGLAGEGSEIAKKSYNVIFLGKEAKGDKAGAEEAKKRM